MKAFLLAAGYGTRLWPLSSVRAKPAFWFMGRPLVCHVLDLLHNLAPEEIWVNLHHRPESVTQALANENAAPKKLMRYVTEEAILGTAGAIVNIVEHLHGHEVVIINAKIVTQIDLAAALTAHRESQAAVTMVCVPNKKRERFTHVDFGADHTLKGFVGIDALTSVAEPFLFTGIQILSPRFFDYLPPPGFSDTIKDVYPRLMAAGERIYVHTSDAPWSEFSTLARYRDLHLEATGGAGFIDPSARVDPTAEVRGSVIWPGATIGPGARLSRCVVADDVEIPAGIALDGQAIIQAERVSDKKDAQRVGGLLVASID